jgi:HEPN domain-containing protein
VAPARPEHLALARSRDRVPDVLFEDLTFQAQQAAEKAVKALLVHLRARFPKTHRITELLTLVQEAGIAVPAEIREAGRLSEYAVESRYPGLSEDVGKDEYRQTVVLAERVVVWAQAVIRSEEPSRT